MFTATSPNNKPIIIFKEKIGFSTRNSDEAEK